jgi:hypothetical protein
LATREIEVVKMKFLHEEFFGKIWKVIDEIKLTFLRYICKILFFGIIIALFALIVWLIITKKYVWLIVLVGVIILGEVAHFIRKSREKAMSKIIEVKNDMDDEEDNPLNKEGLVKGKVLNTGGLLSG